MKDYRRAPHPLVPASLMFLAIGALATVWLADWRWLATGAVVFLVVAGIGGALTNRRGR